MSGIRWTQEEYERYICNQLIDRRVKASPGAPVPVADVESNPVDGLAETHADKKVHPRFRIHYHSKRRRLIDPDGLYSKASTDGLTKGRLLIDDSADWIERVSFSQEVSKVEETIIELWEILK